MPTLECFIGELRGGLDQIEKALRERDAENEARFAKIEDELRAFRDVRSQASGAVWALSRIGAAVICALAGVGWVVANGVPNWFKQLFMR